MVIKRVQAALMALACLGLLLYFWPSLMHNLARIYEALFLEVHYEYVGISDPNYYKELSWKEKIFCAKEYASNEMIHFLNEVETSNNKRVLWDHRGKLTEKTEVNGVSFVVKSAHKNGFLINLLTMGMAVNVWNNADWAKKLGVPVLHPVALVEKRKWNQTKTYVVYLFEGEVCEAVMKRSDQFFDKVQVMQALLKKKHVIHHDFRLRNMVLLDDGSIQFIDIDKLHHYPRNSYVFRERLKRESTKFNLNLVEKTNSDKRLEI